MPISMFDTRTMIAAMEQMLPVRTWLKDTFFNNVETFDTESVDVDIVKGKRRMAPFVNPKKSGQVVANAGYSTKVYKAPMVKPKMVTDAEVLLKRLPGENIYSGKTPDERAAVKLGKDLAELDAMITRREEWMCAQALFKGKINIIGEGVNEEIDFLQTNKEILSGNALWSDAASNPLADLKRWKKAILKTSGINPNIGIFSDEALDAFLAHAGVQKMFDMRLVDTGVIDPNLLPNGVTYIGRIKELGFNIYTYDEWYYDEETSEEGTMVPTKTVTLASDKARMDLLYGAYVDVEEGTFEATRIPRSWTKKDPSHRFVQVVSRPLPVPHQIDSIYHATVLA